MLTVWSVPSHHRLHAVSADELTANKFDQLVSNESNSESDSDDDLQARDPLLHEEDNFDADGLRHDRPVQQIQLGMIPVYDVKLLAIQSWGLAILGQVSNAPRYDKPAMCPWQLSFWDSITTDFKIKGKHTSMLIGVDMKMNGWHIKVQCGKFENSDMQHRL